MSTFQAFLGFYNAVHGTELSLEEAKKSPTVTEAFHDVLNEFEDSVPYLETKTESYKETVTYSGIAREAVYRALATSNMPLSRDAISKATGYKLSSICGRVHELIKAGRVRVAGKGIDPQTNRLVELLEAI